MNFEMQNSSVMASNQKFGWFFAVLFTFGFLYLLYSHYLWLAIASAVLAVVFSLLTVLSPSLLAPLNKAWFALGFLLGSVFSPLVLSIIFFSLIAPVAIITRLFGRDVLFLKKREVSTYWIDKESIAPDSFKNQF